MMAEGLSRKYNIQNFDEADQLEALEELVKSHPNTAVLIVDMQEKCLRKLANSDRSVILSYQKGVLEYCSINNIPVIVLEYQGKGNTIPELKEAVEKVPNRFYLSKSSEDGFTNPILAEKIKECGINHLFLMGVYASACIIWTANGALENGFSVSTSRFAIATRPQYRYRPYLQWFEGHGRLI